MGGEGCVIPGAGGLETFVRQSGSILWLDWSTCTCALISPSPLVRWGTACRAASPPPSPRPIRQRVSSCLPPPPATPSASDAGTSRRVARCLLRTRHEGVCRVFQRGMLDTPLHPSQTPFLLPPSFPLPPILFGYCMRRVGLSRRVGWLVVSRRRVCLVWDGLAWGARFELRTHVAGSSEKGVGCCLHDAKRACVCRRPVGAVGARSARTGGPSIKHKLFDMERLASLNRRWAGGARTAARVGARGYPRP